MRCSCRQSASICWDAEGRNTWRTDRYSPCPRPDAAAYLTFLAALGYKLSAIEQAVVDGIPWTGDTPESSLMTGAADDPGDDGSFGGDAAEPPVPDGDVGDDPVAITSAAAA